MLAEQVMGQCGGALGDISFRRWSSFSSTHIDAVQDHMTRAFCPHNLVLEGGLPTMAFRHKQATLRSITLNLTDYGLSYGRASLSIPPSGDGFIVQFGIAGHAHFVHQGRTIGLDPGFMSVLSPQHQIQQVTDASCRHFCIKLNRSQLEALIKSDFDGCQQPLEFSPDPVPLAGAAATFARFVRTVCDDIDQGVLAYMHPRAVGATEEMLGRLLLASVPHNYSHDYDTSPSSVAPYYVRRAEELIRAEFSAPLTLSDLIAASGVSGRSLHSGFRRYRNETPMGYLKMYRLERARHLLKRAQDKGLGVTDVALATGFMHPSKFTEDYRRRFGELPSWTLKCRGDEGSN